MISAMRHLKSLMTFILHFGVELTLQRVRSLHGDSSNLRTYVKKFIQRCQCCQKMNVVFENTYSYVAICDIDIQHNAAIEYWYHWTITCVRNGFMYILVVVDTFSRFIELYPCKSTRTEECAYHLLSHMGTIGVNFRRWYTVCQRHCPVISSGSYYNYYSLL